MASKAPLTIASDDPEVMALQSIIKGMRHVETKSLTPKHLMVLTSIELCKKALKLDPTIEQIAAFAGQPPEGIAAELDSLVERRYISIDVAKYGAATVRYKVAGVGSVTLKGLLNRKPRASRKPKPPID